MKGLFVSMLLLFVAFGLKSQAILVYGNNIDLEISNTMFSLDYKEKFPSDISSYGLVMIFSTANSNFSLREEQQIEKYLKTGGSVYLGADNWPLVQECNQLMTRFYQSRCYGNFEDSLSIVRTGNLILPSNDKISGGSTTVSFPMSFELKVEAWASDNPIILSGKIGEGKILLDGGYSRFYRKEESQELLDRMVNFLLDK